MWKVVWLWLKFPKVLLISSEVSFDSRTDNPMLLLSGIWVRESCVMYHKSMSSFLGIFLSELPESKKVFFQNIYPFVVSVLRSRRVDSYSNLIFWPYFGNLFFTNLKFWDDCLPTWTTNFDFDNIPKTKVTGINSHLSKKCLFRSYQLKRRN